MELKEQGGNLLSAKTAQDLNLIQMVNRVAVLFCCEMDAETETSYIRPVILIMIRHGFAS